MGGWESETPKKASADISTLLYYDFYSYFQYFGNPTNNRYIECHQECTFVSAMFALKGIKTSIWNGGSINYS